MPIKNMGAVVTPQKPQPDMVNAESFAAFSIPIAYEYVKMLTTNVAADTFYASAKENANAALELHSAMVQADPIFMARALVFARETVGMRLQPIVGLAILSKSRPDLAGKIFKRIIRTPGDLSDLYGLTVNTPKGHATNRRSMGNKNTGFGRHISAWLNSLSEYHVIKYQTGGQGFSLRDILRMNRVKPVSRQQELLFRYIVDRERFKSELAEDRSIAELLPQITAFENMKAASDEATALQWIEAGRLPHEVVTGTLKNLSSQGWAYVAKQMPYFALLRNLVTLNRHKVYDDSEMLSYIVARLGNRDHLAKSGILPFQVLAALNKLAEEPNFSQSAKVKIALEEVFEASLMNMDQLPGKTCIAPDISGSMSSKLTDGSMKCSQLAGLFSAALVKTNPEALVIPFDDRAYTIKINPRDSLMTLTQAVGLERGGTNLSAPLEFLMAKGIVVDNYICISDDQEWSGRAFVDSWNQYKKMAPQAKAFLIRLMPYAGSPAAMTTKDVTRIYGWGDNVLKTIARIATLGADQMTEIQAIEL